jgi:sugar phosphate isomerase/epimerase
LKAVFAFARAVATECVVFCHTVPREGLGADEIRAFARSLSELGKEAHDMGLRLSLHHHHGQPVMHRKDFDLFFDAVTDDAVGLTVDTAHLVKSGVTDIAGLIRDFRHVIDNFHLKDIENGEFRVLGTATIDFDPVFTAIREIGYDGWVSTDEESGADLAQAMEHCLLFMTAGLDTD